MLYRNLTHGKFNETRYECHASGEKYLSCKAKIKAVNTTTPWSCTQLGRNSKKSLAETVKINNLRDVAFLQREHWTAGPTVKVTCRVACKGQKTDFKGSSAQLRRAHCTATNFNVWGEQYCNNNQSVFWAKRTKFSFKKRGQAFFLAFILSISRNSIIITTVILF